MLLQELAPPARAEHILESATEVSRRSSAGSWL